MKTALKTVQEWTRNMLIMLTVVGSVGYDAQVAWERSGQREYQAWQIDGGKRVNAWLR